tara:strand:- start:403 stop:1689 length:1287 start_codon:yes stop_codon:yes gene_type:complete
VSLVTIRPYRYQKYTTPEKAITPKSDTSGDNLEVLKSVIEIAEDRRRDTIQAAKRLEADPKLIIDRDKGTGASTSILMHDKPSGAWGGKVKSTFKPFEEQMKINEALTLGWNKGEALTPITDAHRKQMSRYMPWINQKSKGAKFAHTHWTPEIMDKYLESTGQPMSLRSELLPGLHPKKTPFKNFGKRLKKIFKPKGKKVTDKVTADIGQNAYEKALVEGYKTFDPKGVKVSDSLASISTDIPLKYSEVGATSRLGPNASNVASDTKPVFPAIKALKYAKEMGNVGKGGFAQQLGFQSNPKYWGKGLAKTLNPTKKGLFHNLANAPGGLLKGMTPVGWAMMALNLLGGLAKPHTFLGKIFSDVRLKENIEYKGKSKSGIPVYSFDYKGLEGRYLGVLSKDVPWATSVHNTGYEMVDYNKIDVPFKRIG